MTNQLQPEKKNTDRPNRFTRVFWARGIALVMVSAAITAIVLLDINAWLSMETLRLHHSDLTFWVENERARAAILFVIFYLVLVLFLIPGPFLATLAGGFLFGPVMGTFLTVLGATSGAIVVFLVTRTAAGNFIEKWLGNRVEAFISGFKKNELRYMLVLRLVPIFPFSLISVSAAILGVRFRNFFLGTSLGMIPATYIVSLAGASFADLLERGDNLSPANVFTPQAMFALTGIALLIIIPILYKWVKQ